MDARPDSRSRRDLRSADDTPSLGTLAAAVLLVGASLARRRTPVADGRERSDEPAPPAGAPRSRRPDDAPPSAGWTGVAKRVRSDVGRERLMAVAAGVTFYALLALFPAIAAFVSLYGLVFSPDQVAAQVETLSGVLPSGAVEVVETQVQRVAGSGGGALGFAFAGSLLVSLWSANSGMKAIFDALNVVWGEEEERGFVALNLLALAFTLGAFLVIGGLIASVAIAPAVFAAIPLGETFETLFRWLRYPIALVLLVGLLALVYRYGPSRERPPWRRVLPGAIIGAVAWVAFSLVFTWYVANFGSYNATYGALGAVVGFMVWIWLSTTIVLVAGAVNVERARAASPSR